MKKAIRLGLVVCLVLLTCTLLFTACDDTEVETGNGTDASTDASTNASTEASTEAPDALEALTATDWAAILSEENFENYTLKMNGDMVAIAGGEQVPNHVDEIIKVTADKVEITVHAAEVNGPGYDDQTLLLDGKLAESQKDQYAWLFLTMLEEFANFEYDEATKTFKLADVVSIETVMEGLVSLGDDKYSSFEVPTKLEMKDAEVTISEDGKLVKFVCDYSQTMQMGEGPATVVFGITTWSFSDYGTTVITEGN